MAKELGPKPTSRNPLQLQQRLTMLRNGFPPIPCEAKGIMLEGWTKWSITKALIEAWDGFGPQGSKLKGTGIRLTGNILVLDLDIKDAALMNVVLDAIEAKYPDWFKGALWRHSSAVSLALIGQVSEPVGGFHSRTYGWVCDDGTVIDKAHCETWGSKTSGKYFAAAGPHKEDGRVYGWEGPAPWDEGVTLDSLPVLPVSEVGPLVDLIESVLEAHLQVITPARAMDGATSVYDLTPEMEFVLPDRSTVRMDDLEKQLEVGALNGVYGLLSLADWDASDSKAHCHAFLRERNGRLAITDFYTGVNHYWADEKPEDDYDHETFAEALRLVRDEHKVRDDPDAPAARSMPLGDIPRDEDPKVTYARAAVWLLENIAFYPQAFKGRGGAISIWPDGEFQEPITIAALKGAMSNFAYDAVGPRGGVRRCNPVDLWAARPEQVKIFGVRMRPELPRPMFEEDGLLLVNRYVPPIHPNKGGSLDVFRRFMQRLVPDARERVWAWNWLACLIQHPEWRMIALAMVARDNGSGRGLLAEILMLLLGKRFVVSLPYDSVSGGSKFNAEVVDRLLVYVNEARGPDSHKFYSKSAAREALKVFIEPNHRVPFRVEPKGVDAYFTQAAISTLLLTNSIDALPLNEHDRRVAVVMNGAQMSVGERRELQAWMLKPENIGVLYRALRDHAIEQDPAVFDPYMAPAFRGRDLMVDAGKTALDHAWDEAVARLELAAELYTLPQIIALTRYFVGSARATEFDDLVARHTAVHGCRIGRKRPDERRWRLRHKGDRVAVYAFSEASAEHWTGDTEPDESVQIELDKAQVAVDAPTKAINKRVHSVK